MMALFYSSFSSPPITTAQRVFCGSLRVRAVAFKSVFLPIFPHFGKVFENPFSFFCVHLVCFSPAAFWHCGAGGVVAAPFLSPVFMKKIDFEKV